MTTAIVPSVSNFMNTSGAEAFLPNPDPEPMQDVAGKLWRHANPLTVTADECGCCKGEAQQCLADCR